MTRLVIILAALLLAGCFESDRIRGCGDSCAKSFRAMKSYDNVNGCMCDTQATSMPDGGTK